MVRDDLHTSYADLYLLHCRVRCTRIVGKLILAAHMRVLRIVYVEVASSPKLGKFIERGGGEGVKKGGDSCAPSRPPFLSTMGVPANIPVRL